MDKYRLSPRHLIKFAISVHQLTQRASLKNKIIPPPQKLGNALVNILNLSIVGTTDRAFGPTDVGWKYKIESYLLTVSGR